MAYLLDTNIFIQAKNEYYGFDLCPGFWAWLERQNQLGQVFSIQPVQAELIVGKDKLSKWAKEQGDTFFLSFDQLAGAAMAEVSLWVQHGERSKSQPFAMPLMFHISGLSRCCGGREPLLSYLR